MRPPSVVVRRPVPNSHSEMPFVEWNQEVETLPAQAAAESLAHRVRLRGSHRRPQNPYTQIRKALVDFLGEDAVSIKSPYHKASMIPPDSGLGERMTNVRTICGNVGSYSPAIS